MLFRQAGPVAPSMSLLWLFSKVDCVHGGHCKACVLYCRQWSWPLPLPVQFFGIFPSGGTITEDDQELPWSCELEHKIFISAIGDCSLPAFRFCLF